MVWGYGKVGFTVNKLLLIGSIGLLLGACSTVTNTEEGQENPTKETVVKTVDAVEETEESGIVADEITTTFYPEVTELRQLTEGDLGWYDIIMTRLNAIDDFSGERKLFMKSPKNMVKTLKSCGLIG